MFPTLICVLYFDTRSRWYMIYLYADAFSERYMLHCPRGSKSIQIFCIFLCPYYTRFVITLTVLNIASSFLYMSWNVVLELVIIFLTNATPVAVNKFIIVSSMSHYLNISTFCWAGIRSKVLSAFLRGTLKMNLACNEFSISWSGLTVLH